MKKIAITSGDPAGIGPELCLKLVNESPAVGDYVPLLFGDATVFRRVAEQLSLPLPAIEKIDVKSLNELASVTAPTIFDFGKLTNDDVQPGVVTAKTGQAAYEYIKTAIKAAMSSDVDAIVTGPIHKEALHAAGVPYPGHTEILADQTSSPRHCMMLTSEEITCSLVTAHIGLNEVAGSLTVDAIVDAIELSYKAMQRIRGREDVRLIVCGLNPHAGESGLFGEREEERVIEPAIAAVKAKGIDVVGPLPPDTAFMPAHRQKTDCYVCMYHDQGLIPLKAIAFDTAVNVTLGLPIIRTSVDHGTALDIAWQGKASVTSLIKAVELALRLCSPAKQT